MAREDHHPRFSALMGRGLLIDFILFLLYWFSAAADANVLSIVLGVATLVLSIAALVYLVICRELLRNRSLWLSCGFFAIGICLIVSLILAYP